MAKTASQIQRESNERRGVKNKSFILPLETIAEFEQMAQTMGVSNKDLFMLMFERFKEEKNDQTG